MEWWRTQSFSGQPVLVFHCPHNNKFVPYVQSKSFDLKPLPPALSLQISERGLSVFITALFIYCKAKMLVSHAVSVWTSLSGSLGRTKHYCFVCCLHSPVSILYLYCFFSLSPLLYCFCFPNHPVLPLQAFCACLLCAVQSWSGLLKPCCPIAS